MKKFFLLIIVSLTAASYAYAQSLQVIPGHTLLYDNYQKAAFTSIKDSTLGCAQIMRTFKKDGTNHTICLPFALSSSKLNNSPLAGYSKLKKFVGGNIVNEGTDEVYILPEMEDATSIEAGVPYIIAWESGEDIVNPLFRSVTITTDVPTYTQSGNLTFAGTFWPFAVDANDRTVFFLETSGRTYWPEITGDINGFRALFSIGTTPPDVGTGPASAPSEFPISKIIENVVGD